MANSLLSLSPTGNLTSHSSSAGGSVVSSDPFGFNKHLFDAKQHHEQRHPAKPYINSSRTSVPKIPVVNPFGTVRSANQHPLLTTPTSTTEALPKIIVPNLPIQQLNPLPPAVTQPSSPRRPPIDDLFNPNVLRSSSTTPPPSSVDPPKEENREDDLRTPQRSHVTHDEAMHTSNQTGSLQNGNANAAVQISDLIQSGSSSQNYNKIYNDIQHNSINEQPRTPASSSPFVKQSATGEQRSHSSTQTESSLAGNQPAASGDPEGSSRTPPLIRRSMLSSPQSTALSIFLSISTILSIGILCLTIFIFICSR